jgi:hypothetical protein
MQSGSHVLERLAAIVAIPISICGGASELFRILMNPGVITEDSPLWYLVEGASILNYPSSGNPDSGRPANGGHKLSRTEIIFSWSAARLTALWQWVYTNGATFAAALYAVFNDLPVIQVIAQPGVPSECGRAASSGHRSKRVPVRNGAPTVGIAHELCMKCSCRCTTYHITQGLREGPQ